MIPIIFKATINLQISIKGSQMHKALLKGGGEGRCTQPYIPQVEKLVLGFGPMIPKS